MVYCWYTISLFAIYVMLVLVGLQYKFILLGVQWFHVVLLCREHFKISPCLMVCLYSDFGLNSLWKFKLQVYLRFLKMLIS